VTEYPYFQNPQLDGSAFFWAGNPVGILLIHGFTATTVEIRPLAEFFHRAGYSVAGPLLPGHGTSAEDLNSKSWKEWVAAADQSYQLLKSTCQQVIVGGESMGGLISLFLASIHPEIAGLLLYSPALKVKKLRRTQIARFFMPIMAKHNTGTSKEPLPWQGYTVYPVRAAYQLFRLQRFVAPSLKRVNQPSLIMQGEKDRTIDPKSSGVIFEAISSQKKELEWLKNSGHCVVLDQEYEQVMAKSLAFVQSILDH
jgi:carboxylesterase